MAGQKILLELTLEHPEFARAEAEAVSISLEDKCNRIDERLMLIESHKGWEIYAKRLAFTRCISEYIGAFESIDDLSRHIEDLYLEGKRCAVRVIARGELRKSVPELERQIGSHVSRKAKIDLQNPEVEIRIYAGQKWIAARKIAEVERSSFDRRHSRHRAFSMPISLHPKYARGLLNLCQVGEGKRVLDPFAGTGGILIEAVLLGAYAVGSDIDERMVSGIMKNMEQLQLTDGWEVHRLDVRDIRRLGEFDAVVTDPPYGRSSPGTRDLEELYIEAMSSMIDVLKPGGMLGIVVPDRKLLTGTDDLELLYSFSQNVHRSLCRNYLVFRLQR